MRDMASFQRSAAAPPASIVESLRTGYGGPLGYFWSIGCPRIQDDKSNGFPCDVTTLRSRCKVRSSSGFSSLSFDSKSDAIGMWRARIKGGAGAIVARDLKASHKQ